MAPGGVKGGLFANFQKLEEPSCPGELEDITSQSPTYNLNYKVS
jgi:hypothetical protein